MAAPTPISALVHSSTLVTVGICLLLKYRVAYSLVSLVSIASLLVASMTASIESDMKQVVALSTMRQIRLVALRLSLGHLSLAWLHLVTHGFFKRLMFVSIGNLIHQANSSQHKAVLTSKDKLEWHSNSSILLLTATALSLVGQGYTVGFLSKDLLLEVLGLQLVLGLVVSLLVTVGLTLSLS